MTTVTVAIPAYNYARFLDDAIDAALAQDVELDLVVVDDASDDETWKIAKVAGVRYVRHDENMGAIATYNRCIAEAKGEVFAMVSADDVLAPGALSRALYVLEREPNVGLVYGHCPEFQDGERPHFRPPPKLPKWHSFGGRKWNRWMCRSGRNFITSPEAVVRTSVQRAVGLYNPRLPHSADMEMWVRIAAISDVAYIRNGDSAAYRRHPAQMTATCHKGFAFDRQARLETYASLHRDGYLTDEDLAIALRALRLQEGRETHRFRNRVLRHLQWRAERASGMVFR